MQFTLHVVKQSHVRVTSKDSKDSAFTAIPPLYSLKRLINYCCKICTILCIIFKKCLFIEALCIPLFTKFTHCKPLFLFKNSA